MAAILDMVAILEMLSTMLFYFRLFKFDNNSFHIRIIYELNTNAHRDIGSVCGGHLGK